jgi:hypothetical protein
MSSEAVASARPTVRRRAVSGPVGAVVIGVTASLLIWHRLGFPARGTAWAEDSGRFLDDQLTLGPIDVLWHPYEGYLHLVPRLIVEVAVAGAPIEYYAAVVDALSCCVLGAVCALVFVLSRPVVRAWPIRILLSLVPAITPMATIEIAGNAANVHWYLLFLAPWVFASRPRTWWSASALAITAGVVTLTEIQAVLFVPLLLLNARTRRAVPVAAVGIAGVVVQLLVAATHPRPQPHEVTRAVDVIAGYFVQPVGGSWDADTRAVGYAIQHLGWWVVVVPGLVVIAAFVVAGRRAPRDQRLMIAATAVGSAVVWAAGLFLNHADDTNWTTFTADQWGLLGALRYGAAASMLFLAAVCITADALLGSGTTLLRIAGGALVVVVVAAAALNVGVPSRRAGGPVWSTQIVHAQERCAADSAASVSVAAAPPQRGWRATIPCSLVDRR